MIEIYNDNCLNYFKSFKRRDGDVVVTDPPFNINYRYRTYKDSIPKQEWLDLLEKVCKPPCVIILYPEMMFEFAQRIDRIPNKCVSWVYNSNTPRVHRMVAWFGLTPDFTKVGQPYKEPNHKKVRDKVARGEMARLYDWWDINLIRHHTAEKVDHPCQMPFEVMRRIVGITPCKRVIDPFAGSGTTLCAAKYWQLDGLGVEIDPKYCKIIEERINESTQT